MSRARSDTAPRPGCPEESKFIQTPVVATIDQTADIRTFRLARPTGFDFRPGQFLTVAVDTPQGRQTRCYSISSAPESARHLEITVKRIGLVSTTLHTKVGVGTLLSVKAPEGRFVYPDGDHRPLVLIGGGIGCTPLMSILRHAVASQPSRPVTTLLSGRTAGHIPFLKELQSLKRQHPGVRIGVTLTREGGRPGFGSGRIDETLLHRAAPDPANTLFYVCGPMAMIADMKRLLAGLGARANQILAEVFEPAAAGASVAELGVPAGGAAFPAKRKEQAAAIPARASARGGEEVHEEVTAHILQFPRKEHAKEILRFARGEMMLHWAIAVPFLICFATGMTMKFFMNLHGEGLTRDTLSFVHRVAGGALAVFPALAILRNWRDYKVHIENVKVGFKWTVDDLKWLFLMGPATVSKRIVLPEQRKFNAAERMNFMMVMCTYPVFIVSGISLWMPGIHFMSWIVHVATGLVAPLLMLGHIYMAVVNPSTRVGLSGMISGRVDREWARHHYARWYRENFHEDGTPKSDWAREQAESQRAGSQPAESHRADSQPVEFASPCPSAEA